MQSEKEAPVTPCECLIERLLPDELIDCILVKTGDPKFVLCKAALVNRRWRSCTTSELIWKTFVQQEFTWRRRAQNSRWLDLYKELKEALRLRNDRCEMDLERLDSPHAAIASPQNDCPRLTVLLPLLATAISGPAVCGSLMTALSVAIFRFAAASTLQRVAESIIAAAVFALVYQIVCLVCALRPRPHRHVGDLAGRSLALLGTAGFVIAGVLVLQVATEALALSAFQLLLPFFASSALVIVACVFGMSRVRTSHGAVRMPLLNALISLPLALLGLCGAALLLVLRYEWGVQSLSNAQCFAPLYATCAAGLLTLFVLFVPWHNVKGDRVVTRTMLPVIYHFAVLLLSTAVTRQLDIAEDMSLATLVLCVFMYALVAIPVGLEFAICVDRTVQWMRQRRQTGAWQY